LIIVNKYHEEDFKSNFVQGKEDYKRDFKGRMKRAFGITFHSYKHILDLTLFSFFILLVFASTWNAKTLWIDSLLLKKVLFFNNTSISPLNHVRHAT